MQFVCQHDAITRLGTTNAFLEKAGPTAISGVGGISCRTPHGVYRVALPLSNGEHAVLTGVCLDRITQTFPLYPL